jgi:hypothetical protein
MAMHLRRFAPLLVVTAGLVTGCLFSPEKKPPLPVVPFEYLRPSTPNAVLQNMKEAYERRDSVQTAEIYALGYEGTSTDLASPTPAVYNLTWFDEKHHVAALKLNTDIASISVDLGPQGTWLRLSPEPTDPPTWAVVQIQQANIQVNDVNSGFLYQSQNNKMLYTFAPYDVPAVGDTLWNIIRWTEVRN